MGYSEGLSSIFYLLDTWTNYQDNKHSHNLITTPKISNNIMSSQFEKDSNHNQIQPSLSPPSSLSLQLYQIDAFTSSVFGGNPACVVPLFQDEWHAPAAAVSLDDEILLKIAQENAVAETAFVLLGSDDDDDNRNNATTTSAPKGKKIPLRWFTPEIEMDLCGHATLAAAHCLAAHVFPDSQLGEIVFETKSGDLTVKMIPMKSSKKNKNNGAPPEFLYQMDFPSRMPLQDTSNSLPDSILKSLSHPPREVYKARDYVLLYDSEEEIQSLSIVDQNLFDQVNLDPGGVCVTAPVKAKRTVVDDRHHTTNATDHDDANKQVQVDFVSRFFTPQASILEDPVTGSAHCSLVPFWAERLQKQQLVALQISDRVGTLYCQNNVASPSSKSELVQRVLISGRAKTYSQGVIFLS